MPKYARPAWEQAGCFGFNDIDARSKFCELMRRAIWEIARLHMLASILRRELLTREMCTLQCPTMQAEVACIDGTKVAHTRCANSLACSRRCCIPSSDAAWGDGRRDAERTSEDRMRHSGAVSDTIPRLCVKEVVSKMPLRSHSNAATTMSRTQVCDGEVGARV